jgi:predicted helicase
MANARHSKAAEFVRSGIFDNLDSFAKLEARINRIPEEKDRGDVFEIFIEAYLATQAITQWVKHWVVGGIPLTLRERYNLPADATGIDGIYETHDSTHIAYQVKYRQCPNLTYAEVAPFLGLTEHFTDRVIFTNASTLSEKASKRTRWVNRETFLELSAEALAKIEAWLKSKPLPVLRFLPDPNYQTQALAEIKAALEKHPCATAVMACGTGKTLVALWAAEQSEPKTVLVLVPSLMLLSQTLREWSEQTSWGIHFSYLCVCSDKTVGLKDEDKSAAGFPIRTDPKIVRQFLDRQTDDIKIVFCTYKSADVVGKAMQPGEAFDFAVFDEAHKTTGHDGSMSSYALTDKNICIRKRLFLTATPRHIDIRHRNKEGEFKVQSMDNAAVYGPRAHTLSFAAAAKKGIICRYKVIISLIDKKMISDFARKHGITIVERDEIAARWVANLIALKQSVETVEASKIITFHSRKKTAHEFATSGSRGIGGHLHDYDARTVNSDQSSVERGDIIRAFADAPKSILTNAHCLTEGVNIPAVDMVAFIDPKQSRVDIAQAVGRAMRKPRGQTNKTVGYVMVPLFAGMDERDKLGKAVHSGKFDVVADVLNALQEHDEELVEIIRELKERKGRGEPFDPRRLNEKVQTIGPLVELDRLSASIAVEIVERIGVRWDERFGELLAYKAEFKDCNVPSRYSKNRQLGTWVVAQRQAKKFGQLNDRQIKLLTDIGFDWQPRNEWDDMFERLVAFEEKNKNCNVPQNYKADPDLGKWVFRQRQRYKAGTLEEGRYQKLKELGIVWNAKEGRP